MATEVQLGPFTVSSCLMSSPASLMEDDECAIEEYEPESIILSDMDIGNLIRAASTFLSITGPKLGPQTRLSTNDPQFELLRDLNRIATMFVTKAKADVAAVAIVQSSTNYTLIEHSVPDPTEAETLIVAKNSAGTQSTTKRGRILPPIPVAPTAQKKFGISWLVPFLKGGPMNVGNHAYQLQALCNTYASSQTGEEQANIMREIKHFTYLQCQPKITQRLTITLHPQCSTMFYAVFKPGSITPEILRSRFVEIPWTARLGSRRSEERFLPIMEYITGYKFSLDDNEQIALDRESTVHYHTFVWSIFDSLRKELDQLRDFRDPQKSKEQGYHASEAAARRSLDIVDQRMSLLADLVNRTSSFHKHLAHPEIAAWMVKQAMAPGITIDVPQDVRDILEDEDVLLNRETVVQAPIECLIKWLRLVVQWTEAIVTLTKPLNRTLSILVITPTPPENPTSQASLDQLLSYVLGFRDNISVVKRAIQKRASDMINLDEQWGALTAGQWDQWVDRFYGKVHCETLLLCLKSLDYDGMKEKIDPSKQKEFENLLKLIKRSTNALGVSKACCYLCAQYLDMKGTVKVRGSSGRIFPWSLPDFEIDRRIGEALLMDLKDHVWSSLERMNVLVKDRTLTGSDDGSGGDWTFTGGSWLV